MLTINKENNINSLLTNSYYKILDYKLDLNKLYNIIFDFCEKNNIIISNNNINISIIKNKKYKLTDINNDFIFNLLSTNPYKYAINLANYIYKFYSKYIVVSSYLNNKEIIITIDNNKIITFNLLFEYNDKILKKFNFSKILINPFNDKSYNIYYGSNLYELLNISYKLYHPSNFLKFLNFNFKNLENEEINNTFEQKFYYLIESIINNKISTINYNVDIRNKINSYLLYSINSEKYIDIKLILLDDYATNIIKEIADNKKINQLDIINTNQIMTVIVKKDKIKLLENLIINYLKNNNLMHLYKFNNKTVSNYIIDDFRLKKNILSVTDKNQKRIILLNIYTSVDYELFPLINIYKNILIPHPIVIIRFYILNLFNNLLYNPNYDNNLELYILNKIKLNYNFIKKINSLILDKSIIINYYGQYINDRIDKFKFGAKIYRPWQYKLKFKKLLQIN